MTLAIRLSTARRSTTAAVLGPVAVVAFFVLLHPPGHQPAPSVSAPPLAEAQGGGDFSNDAIADDDSNGVMNAPAARFQMVPSQPARWTPETRASRVLLLRVGPDDRYVTVGQIANGARVEVVGRNERGDWLAISLMPGATTYGWVRASGVSGVANVTLLPVAPVKLLP